MDFNDPKGGEVKSEREEVQDVGLQYIASSAGDVILDWGLVCVSFCCGLSVSVSGSSERPVISTSESPSSSSSSSVDC